MERKRRFSRFLSMILAVCLAVISVGAGAADAYGLSFAWTPGTKYIAHRGLSAKAPENSPVSIALAANNSKVFGVEFDIWESSAEPQTKTVTENVTGSDGSITTVTKTVPNDPLLIVMHDSTLSRTCKVNVATTSLTRETIKNYPIVIGKRLPWYGTQYIPTADEALASIYSGSSGAVPVIELKHRLSQRGLDYLFSLIGNKPAFIISFDFNAVSDAAAKSMALGVAGNVQTMYLRKSLSAKKYSSTIKKMKAAGIGNISLRYTAVSRKTVKKFHKAGISVCTWTVPSKKVARKMKQMKVDYITANKPY